MKHKHRWINHLLGALFALVLSFCAVGCIITGFDLAVPPETMVRLLRGCGIISVLSALILYLPFGGCWLLLLIVPAARYLWNGGLLWDQLKTIACTISSHFNNVYGWQILGEPIAEEIEPALFLLAGFTALTVCYCLCRSLHILIAVPSVLFPLVLCLITTDTLPDEPYLYLMITCIVLLMITDLARRRNPVQGGLLTLITAIPAAAALALLFWLNPQTEYISRAGEIQKETVTWFQKAMTSVEAVMNGNISGVFSNQTLNLRHVGPKNNLSYSVMRVYTPYPGTVYLRGQDYDIYTGTAWESSPERSETFPTGSENAASGTISIATYGVLPMLYVPYYPTDTVTLTGGSAANWDNLNTYSFPFSRIPAVTFGSGTVDSGYTDLPPETYEWASELLGTILKGDEADSRIIQKIMHYVQRSAAYDRSTPAMDPEYDDFARWFLEESNTGYCVHFATAATLLLRAAGIPARYVEGYMTDCDAAGKNIVTNQEAHAWVEYFDPVFSVWWILETTPANASLSPDIVYEETETEDTDDAEITPEEETFEQEEITESARPNASGGFSGTSGDSEEEEEPEEESEEFSDMSVTSGTDGVTALPEEKNSLPGWIRIPSVLILILAALPLQSHLRILRKRRLWNSGSPNETALHRWHQLMQIAVRLDLRLPRGLEELALKAKFSQHVLTSAELQQFEHVHQKLLPMIDNLPLYKKLILRMIFAIG